MCLYGLFNALVKHYHAQTSLACSWHLDTTNLGWKYDLLWSPLSFEGFYLVQPVDQLGYPYEAIHPTTPKSYHFSLKYHA